MGRGELVPKRVWRVKLVAELQPGVTTETEVARIERDEQANLAELGLRLEEAKQLTAALQAEMVPAQVTGLSECRRSCVACGSTLASKGHYRVRFRSLFGDVPLRVRRLLICPCQSDGEAKSSAVLNFGGTAVAVLLNMDKYAMLRFLLHSNPFRLGREAKTRADRS